MNLQPIIDNLPMIIAAFGLLLWAAARLTEAKAKANPQVDKWDDLAPKLQWASHMYSQAIDWLCDSGKLKFKGQEKLAELNRLTKAFEDAWFNGNYRDAINAVIGFYTDAKAKALLANPTSQPGLTADTPAQE